jgi:hypothetical protein
MASCAGRSHPAHCPGNSRRDRQAATAMSPPTVASPPVRHREDPVGHRWAGPSHEAMGAWVHAFSRGFAAGRGDLGANPPAAGAIRAFRWPGRPAGATEKPGARNPVEKNGLVSEPSDGEHVTTRVEDAPCGIGFEAGS